MERDSLMPAKHILMRNTNTLLILDYIRMNGETTRRKIQRDTKLSWAAISNITSDLIARDILQELSPSTKNAGRNPGFLDFTPMRNLTIGMELNAEGITILLLNLRCEVIDSNEAAIASLQKEDVIEQMLMMVEEMLKKYQLETSQLLGIGIAMQGSVDKEGTTSLYNAYFYDWRDVPLKDICETRFGVPVHVMHDPMCIALAEQWQRKLSDKDDFALIRLAYGIGMCYITQGQPIAGFGGASGELGHMVMEKDGPLCSCGNHGCLESYCSIRGLAKRIVDENRNRDMKLPKELSQFDDSNVQLMYCIVEWGAKGAREGQKELKKLFDDAGYYLGIGIANIVSLFNPEYVILTGGLLDFRDLFLESAKKCAETQAWKFSDFQLLISDGGRRQASKGAALYFINEAFFSHSSHLIV